MPELRSFPEVPVEKLRWRCDPELFRFQTTRDIPCATDIIGQERAIKAIQLGLSVLSRGYNIYVQAALESEEFQTRRDQMMEKEGQKGRELIRELEERIKKENCILVESWFGPVTKTEIAPLVEGKPRNLPLEGREPSQPDRSRTHG